MSNTTTRNLESREVRELRDDEVALVSGGGDKASVLGAAAVMAIDGIFYAVVEPLMRAGLV